MSFLDDPVQRRIVLFGVPLVVGAVLGAKLLGGSSDSTNADQTAAAPTDGWLPGGDTSAIGVDQLAEFESGVANSLALLQQQVAGLTATGVGGTGTTPPKPKLQYPPLTYHGPPPGTTPAPGSWIPVPVDPHAPWLL